MKSGPVISISMDFDNDATQLLASLPEALLVSSRQGEVVYVNKALETLTEFSSIELVGQHVSMLLPAGERQRLDIVSWFSRWASHPNKDQLRFLTIDGITKTKNNLKYRVRVSSFRKEEEIFFLIVLQDISAEHQATQDLRHAQLISSRIIAIGRDAVLTINDENRICFWNQQAEKLFGYPEDEILDKNLDLLIPEPFVALHHKYIQGFTQSSEASKLMGDRSEIVGKHKDGTLLPLEASITKTTIAGQQFISAQVRDISHRKIAEKMLLESESRYKAVFENALQAMALLSISGEVIEINATAKTWLLDDTNPIGKNIWALNWSLRNGDDISRVLKDNVQSIQPDAPLQSRVTLFDGKTDREVDFSLRLTIRPETSATTPAADNSEEKISYIIAEARDITRDNELQ